MSEGEEKVLEKAVHYMCSECKPYPKSQHFPGSRHKDSPDPGLTLLTSIWIGLKIGGEWQHPCGAQVTREQIL